MANTTDSSPDNKYYTSTSYYGKSYQSGIKGDVHGSDPNASGKGLISSAITNYALFQGGLNATHDALAQYDPLKTGFGRLFMIRTPIIVDKDEMKIFKHILEYANTSVTGLGDIQLESGSIQGGYTNREIKVPTHSTESTSQLTIKVYEMAGSPITRVMRMWINGISDVQSGLAHSNGLAADGVEPTLANQSAEFIYVATDASGRWDHIEYACLFACCIPTKIDLGHFDYTSGTHEIVQKDLTFSCIKYDGPQVNEIAKILMKKYNSLVNSIDFYPGISIFDKDLCNEDGTLVPDVATKDIMYNPETGKLQTYDTVGRQHVADMQYTGYMASRDELDKRASHVSSNTDDTREAINGLEDIPTISKTNDLLNI